jgi:hypothetical protein
MKEEFGRYPIVKRDSLEPGKELKNLNLLLISSILLSILYH